jgi:hypothetical protein
MRSILLTVAAAWLTSGAEMTGYISDAACGWNNARPAKEAKECAGKCVRAGWDPVFVADGSREVTRIANTSRALPFVGDHVTIRGTLARDLVTIATIRKSADVPKKSR